MGELRRLSRFSNAPGSPATRNWHATTSPTAWRPTASSARNISSVNTVCPRNFSRGTPKLSPLPRAAPGSQIRRRQLGIGLPYGCHHPPRREAVHGRQSPQGQALAPLDGPHKVLAVGPCFSADIPDGSPLIAKLLWHKTRFLI